MADGVILIKANPTQSPQYWTAFAFRTIEGFSVSYTVMLTNGQQRNFRKDEIGAIIEEPKWQEMTVVSDVDWQNLEQQKMHLISSLGKYPQLKDWVNSLTTKFDELLNSRSSFNVLYRGRLITREDFDKLRGNIPSAPSSSDTTLTVGGKRFTNVKVLSIKGGRLGFSHDGGVGGVQMSILNEKQIEWVKATSPALFEAHLKELNMVADKANLPSISPNEDANSSKAIASKESEIAKAIEPNQPDVSQNTDTGSSKAMSSKKTEPAEAAEIIPQLSDAKKQAELSNRIRALRLKVESRAISNQYEMLKSSALSDGKKEDQAIRSQIGMTSTKDTSSHTSGMAPFSGSKKVGSHLDLPRAENDLLSPDQKKRLEETARAYGKNPHEVIRSAEELAKRIQHDMMYPEDSALREREESRRKSGFYSPGQ